MKILFLGYKSKDTKIIKFLKKKNFLVKEHGQKFLYYKNSIDTDAIISFGYRKIIKSSLIKKINRPIINLHMSYLPYNRGSHPNFWSFIDKTPSGVSIHEIDTGIDTGKIIFQKKINFKLNRLLTFEDTYNKLFIELENLFIKKWKLILEGKYKTKKNYFLEQGTFHKKKDLPKNIYSWKISIYDYLKNYNKSL
jgi:methionyl-tRNA formyltransferase